PHAIGDCFAHSIRHGPAGYSEDDTAAPATIPTVPYIAGLNDRSAALAASSNCSSSFELMPRRPAATFRANSTYSILRFTDQSEGGLAATARKLLVLSASLSILALGDFADAVSICMSFRFALGRLLSSVTSITIDATWAPRPVLSEKPPVALQTCRSLTCGPQSGPTSAPILPAPWH